VIRLLRNAGFGSERDTLYIDDNIKNVLKDAIHILDLGAAIFSKFLQKEFII